MFRKIVAEKSNFKNYIYCTRSSDDEPNQQQNVIVVFIDVIIEEDIEEVW